MGKLSRQNDNNEEDDCIVVILDYLMPFNVHCHIVKPLHPCHDHPVSLQCK